MKKSILIILVSIFTLSCNSDDKDSGLANVETTLIAKDNLYRNGAEGINEQNMVITDQNAWNDLISQMDSANTVSDHFSETDIDFSQYQIIAMFLNVCFIS